MSCEIFQILFSTIYSLPSVSPSYNSLLVEMISMIYWRHWTFVSTISILPIPNFFFLLDSTMFISIIYQLQLHVTFFLQCFPNYNITSGRGEQSNRLQIVGLGDCLYSDGTYKQGSVLYVTWELICASVSAIHCNLSNNYKTSKHTKYVLLHYYVPPTYDLHCSLLLLLLLSWIIFYSLCTLWICHIIHSLFYAFRN